MSDEIKKGTTEVNVQADIHIQKPSTFEKFRNIYLIVFICLFIMGFFVGSGTSHNEGGTVRNPSSLNDGQSYPPHDDEYTGWYFLRFTFKGEGWQESPMNALGYVYPMIWDTIEETYPEQVVIFLVLNILLVSAPFIYDSIRNKECENTKLNFKENRIYGSCGSGLKKVNVDIPFVAVNEVNISNPDSDFKTGKSLEIVYGDKKATFNYIHNAEEIKDYIFQCITDFKKTNEEDAKLPSSATLVNESTADELKKFKELLDMGAITQEEFDAKKKQILGL